MSKYDHILHLQRPVDTKHPSMSLHNRAAQFAPFDALTGFGGRIYETSRLTEDRIDLSDDVKQQINGQLQYLSEHLEEHPEISVTHFVPDLTKDGGSYETVTAAVKKIDAFKERLFLDPDIQIAFDDITEIIFS